MISFTIKEKNRFNFSYLVIPLLVIMVAFLGSEFTAVGINSGWYETINKPAWTPDGSFIGAIWTSIFILITISALIVWNKFQSSKRLKEIIALFLLNGFLNFSWSFLFFTVNLTGVAVVWAGLIALSVLALIVLIWPKSKIAAFLLIPYFGWVSFATYLNMLIWQMN